MLIKALWNNALAAKAQLSKQSSFASLLNTNIPMGNKKGQSALVHGELTSVDGNVGAAFKMSLQTNQFLFS